MKAVVVASMAESSLEWRRLFARLRKSNPLKSTTWVGVDRGLQISLQMGIRCEFGIGDWDSLAELPRKAQLQVRQAKIPQIHLPQNKDRSDLWHAVSLLAAEGFEEITCVGVTGGRPDHHLAMIQDLSDLSGEYLIPNLRVLSPEAEYQFLCSRSQFQARAMEKSFVPGQTVSFFTVGTVAAQFTLRGFEFSKSKLQLESGSHGLSNRVKTSRCQVQVHRGVVLAIVPLESP